MNNDCDIIFASCDLEIENWNLFVIWILEFGILLNKPKNIAEDQRCMKKFENQNC